MKIVSISMNMSEYEKLIKKYVDYISKNGKVSLSKFIKMELGLYGKKK